MHSQKEQFLLFRIRQLHDAKAYGEIYKQYAPAVRRLLAIKLPTEQDIEDALSTTFGRGWNYMTSAEIEVESIGGLMFTIARGVIAEFYRKRPAATVSIDQGTFDDILVSQQTDSTIRINAEISLVKKALLRLTDDQREAIILRYFEDVPIRNIAVQLQKTENATRVLIHRALKELRSILET